MYEYVRKKNETENVKGRDDEKREEKVLTTLFQKVLLLCMT